MQNALEQLKNDLLNTGFDRCAIVTKDILQIENVDEVRNMCKVNYCGRYGKTWSCPPACGEIEQCANKVRSYSHGVLVQKVYALEDSYDFESAQEGQKDFTERFCAFATELRKEYPDLLALGAGTCSKCDKCTYPDSPCRYPDTLFYSMESHGILVSTMCKQCGVPYISGQNTVTYTGVFLIK